MDCLATDVNGEDYSWDAIWTSKSRINDNGWVVEMKIPYAALRFTNNKIQTWGINFVRDIKRENAIYSWTNVDNKVGNIIQQAGILEGIENVKTPTRLFLMPYSSFYLNANGTQKTIGTLKGGMDIKYGINDAFTLDAILIPDFGQTKYDDKILNLGPFEQQFNENRAFFTEGTDLFNKGNLLYSFLACLLFISFPIHTEVVANIKSVDEILAMLFGFLALNKLLDYLSGKKIFSVIMSILFFFLSLLCKESSITLLAVFPLLVYYFGDEKFKENIFVFLAFIGITVFYFLIRSNVYGIVPIGTIPSSSDNLLVKVLGSFERYTTAIYYLGLYLLRIVVPYGLTFDASFPQLSVVGISSVEFLLAFVVLSSLFAIAIYGVVKKELYGFALMFFFITASVSSNIFTLIGTQYGERLMFMPSFGIAFSAIACIAKFNFKQAPVLVAIVVLIYGGITINRNNVWENNYTLYRSGLISAPNSARTNYYLGNYLIKESNLAGKSQPDQNKILNEGISYLKKSVHLTPYFADSWDQMGLAYMRLKEYDSSKIAFVNFLFSQSNVI
jgi:hypothetical protein